jgi:hypothetical protein
VNLAEGHAHLLVERSLDRVHHGVRAAGELLALLVPLREVAVEDAGGHVPPLPLPEFYEVGGLSLFSDYGDRAMGVPDHRIRDTAHQSPP